ncbi:MAG: nucleotide exchange factor GrpE [Pseudomonadota bacterium]|nr:nucleotide exchange factor GrpE [Pseudomonadota bacterium]
MAEKTKQHEDADSDSGTGPDAAAADVTGDAADATATQAGESQTEADDAAVEGGDDQLEMLMAERESLKDQLLRALADVENMRRRTEREMESARKYGHTGFARDLVGAIDNLARAIEAAPKGDEPPTADALDGLITGIEMSWTEIQATMERHGIRRISPQGEKFDYNFHQAMFEMPHPELAPGTVVEVVQHGYVLHDRLLRPAMVGVAKVADSRPDSEDTAENS